MEEKQYCTAFFMDIEKAFDKVWHEGLLHTLTTHFPSQIYNLLASYLKDRTFTVKIKGTYSEIKVIKAGVPQGSVLGPILYTLYTADIPVTDITKLLTFADDTAVLAIHSDLKVAVRMLQEHITRIEKWLREKKIKANAGKYNHITFTLCKKQAPHVKLNNMLIPQTKKVKYLGLHLDSRLTWKHHIQAIINNIRIKRRQMCWLTSRKSKLSTENKLKVYKTIIKPIWTYGIPLWGIAAKSHIIKLETIQSQILRTIVNAPWYFRNDDIRKDLKISTVKEEITQYVKKYREKVKTHPNQLAAELHTNRIGRRLRRLHPADI